MPSDMTEALARARRSVQALAVGDAFGERFFGPPERVTPRIRDRALPPTPWRYTDDTAMAISVYETLAAHARIVQDDLAERFARSYARDPMRGYGAGAHQLLSHLCQGGSWRLVAPAMFGGQGSFGNGGAMRVAPVGAFHAQDPEAAARDASLSAEVTHAHPEGIAGAVAVAVAASVAGAGGGGFDRAALFDAALAHTPASRTRDGIDRARKLPDATSVAEAAELLGNGSQIAAFDTVPLCLWLVARHPDDFEAAMWSAVEALGDRDTTCAIVAGVLAGRAAPPAAWIDATETLPI